MTKKFWDALSAGDTTLVAQMLQERPSLLNERSALGLTPLMVAVSSMDREVECVELLIRLGADVNATITQGYTALHFAVDVDGPTCRGKMPSQIINLLVKAGARLEARQGYGWTPLMRAVMEGTADEVQALLAVGADPNPISPDYSMPVFIRGRTTLMAAIASPEKLKLLLGAGAKIDSKDDHNQTAIEYAYDLLDESDERDYQESVVQSIALLKKAKS